MSDKLEITILGVDEVVMLLNSIEKRMSTKILAAAGKRAVKPMITAMRAGAKIRKSSSFIAGAVGSVTSKKYKGRVYVGIRRNKRTNEKFNAWMAHWALWGTKGIKQRSGYNSPNPNPLFAGYVKSVPKGGKFRDKQPGNDFIKSGADTTDTIVQRNYAKEITIEIHRVIQRHKGNKLKVLK